MSTPNLQAVPLAEPTLPIILAPGTHRFDDGSERRVSNDEFCLNLQARLPKHTVFKRGGVLGRIVGPNFEPLTVSEVQRLVDRHVSIEKHTAHTDRATRVTTYSTTYIPCPKPHAQLLLDTLSAPEIASITNFPVLRRHGVWLDTPGYNFSNFNPFTNSEYGHYYFYDSAPAKPLDIDEVFHDFPFATEQDRINALALALTPLLRLAINGPVPLFVVDAAVHRTGKTLLVQSILGGIISRRAISGTPMPENTEEFKKLVHSLLIAGDPYIFFDNVPDRKILDNPQLAMLVTAPEIADRILGASKIVRVKNNSLVVLTGNNLRLSPELEERAIWIRLQSKVEHPGDRTGFRHPNILQYAIDNHDGLLLGLQAMIDRWDGHRSAVPLGSFDEWAAIVYGVLESNGYVIDAEARRRRILEHDDDHADMVCLVDAWKQQPSSKTPLELLHLAKNTGVMGWILEKPTESSQSITLGRYLQRYDGQVISGRKVERHRVASGVLYFLRFVNGDDESV